MGKGDGGGRQLECGVDLPAGRSASATFHRILADVVETRPDAFAGADFPSDPRVFRKDYPDALGRLEAARASHPERAELARALVERSHASLVLRDAAGNESSLVEALRAEASALPLACIETAGSGCLTPEIESLGESFRGEALRAFARERVAGCEASTAVAESIDWLLDHALDEAAELDLRGRRIAVLGAAAELAPTRHWLAAGADVLWIDLAPPPDALTKDSALSGRLFHVPGGSDLLTQPCEIRATLEAFAAEAPIDVGLYGYAPGRGREWRLAASMNAIVNALPRASVRSVTLLISPTSPAVRTPEEDAGEAQRRETRSLWQRALAAMGLLGKGGGALSAGGTKAANRSVVSIQGVSYQAAQYLEKWMTAEAWATGPDVFRVSANVAGITRTRSLDHPIFVAAFAGAGAFGVSTYAPETTRGLMALLALRDWLDPEAPRPEALFSVRVHGGLYGLSAPLEPALRVAALIGMVRNPRLIAGLLRR